MHPEPLVSILGFGLGLYTIAHGFGFLVALPVALWLGREKGVPAAKVLDVWLVCASADLIGTPILIGALSKVGIQLPATFSLAQLVVVLAAAGVYWALNPLDRSRYPGSTDLIAVPAMVYLMVARLGCFAAGCCHGRPAYDLTWAVTFSNPGSACLYRGIPVHPTQLYEAGGAFLIAGALLAVRDRPSFRGALLWLAVMSYCLLRFVVELFRGDPRLMVGPTSFAQIGCVVLFALSLGALLRRRRPVAPPVRRDQEESVNDTTG